MIWGVLHRRVASSRVMGQAWKAKPTVSGQAVIILRLKSLHSFGGRLPVQSSSYHTFRLSNRSFSSDDGDVVDAAVPLMGESVTDGTLANFLKKPGGRVEADEPVAQIETHMSCSWSYN
ncbi:uncharacterized protein LOC133803814 isoform X2 [Humulus lupulus]|uniref:uncharacterized protein LOC133803814 isoform X2 n=1 Tax=Humulus lupulus TaxID=3486 RepID=UPI002B410C33|nr:uncharacterized protein LOC133803814 isoform X2 [Humulus lupulus]XP_062097930.1 uncharacterized protein LOC133803814 isoform X2 [Humulus lupulus]